MVLEIYARKASIIISYYKASAFETNTNTTGANRLEEYDDQLKSTKGKPISCKLHCFFTLHLRKYKPVQDPSYTKFFLPAKTQPSRGTKLDPSTKREIEIEGKAKQFVRHLFLIFNDSISQTSDSSYLLKQSIAIMCKY